MPSALHASSPLAAALLACCAAAACGGSGEIAGAPGDAARLPASGADASTGTTASGPPLSSPTSYPAARDILLPGPAPRPPLQPIADIGLPTDAGCARCHEEIAAEQDASLHHNAWQNAYFARAYAEEKTPFCRKCHAPGADPEAEPPAAAREAGVGCTTCHVVPAGVVGTRAMAAQEKGHAVLGDPRLATPAACGACHDFAFPGPPGVTTGPMQDTLGEHRRSTESGKPCQECHMPLVPSRGGGSHRSHAFRVQGDAAMLAKAVVVKEATLEDGQLRLSLAPGTLGHAFPTGDLFRRAEVRATPLDASGKDLSGGAGHPAFATSREVLGRTFAPAPLGKSGMAVTVQRSDTRLAGPRTIVLAVPPGTRRAKWQIVWQRLPPWLAEHFRMRMADNETVLLEGSVSR